MSWRIKVTNVLSSDLGQFLLSDPVKYWCCQLTKNNKINSILIINLLHRHVSQKAEFFHETRLWPLDKLMMITINPSWRSHSNNTLMMRLSNINWWEIFNFAGSSVQVSKSCSDSECWCCWQYCAKCPISSHYSTARSHPQHHNISTQSDQKYFTMISRCCVCSTEHDYDSD